MCIKETSLLRTQNMFDRKQPDSFRGGGGGGGGIYSYFLPPYNSNFQYLEIKSLVPRILNLQDSAMLHLYFLFIDFALYYCFR